MTPTIPVRLAALDRDTRALHARIERVRAELPAEPERDPQTLAVVLPLYDAAQHLRTRAVGIAVAMGRPGFFDGPVKQAERGAALVLNAAHAAPRTVTQRTSVAREGHGEVNPSVTPGSRPSLEQWERARTGQDLPNVRVVGVLPRPAINLVIDRLENVPAHVIELTDELGARSAVFSGRLTDVWGYRSLRGVQPRGWPKGKTWDIVPGGADERGFAANPSRELTGRGHGSTSLVLHEYGHVVDAAVARPQDRRVSESRPWRDGPWREVRRREGASAYARRYAEEWFAESFARFTKSAESSAALARWYPQTWRFLREHVGTPRFG